MKAQSAGKFLYQNARHKWEHLKYWMAHREEVENWISSYLLSSSLAVHATRRAIKDPSLLGDWSHRVRYRRGLSVEVGWDGWHELPSLLETYRGYVRRADVSLKPGDVVIDIGAHIGAFSVPLAFDHPGIRVFAFEPDPRNYRRLLANRDANAIDPRTFMAENVAVYGRSGTVELAVGASSTTGSIKETGFFKGHRSSSSFLCRAKTLQEVFADGEISRCRLLKVDCEGGEYDIFRAFPVELLQRVENLILEAHPAAGGSPEALRRSLEGQGFHITGIDHGNGCWDYFGSRAEA